MKNLITYLKALWSWVADSQSTDVSLDCRLTVGSPSFHRRSTMLKLVSVLVLILTIGSGNVWGAGAITVTSSAITLPNGSTTVGKGAWMSATGESQGYWSKDVTVGSYGTITCSDAGDQNSTDYLLQLKASGGYIQTTINSPAGVDITIGLKKGSNGTLTVSLTGATNKTYTSTSWGSLSISTTNTSATLKVTKTGSKAAGISYITITPKAAASCTTKPTVGSSLTSVSATVNSITATVPISAIGGCNITENGLVYSTSVATPTVGAANCTKVTTTACGGTAANKTVTISDLACGTPYYVRGYATNAAGTQYTNVTTQSTSACPLYTVTLKDNDATLTQASAGASVTLPSRAGCSGYTFAGWTKTWVAPQSSWTTTAPTIIPAGSYTPTANENLYPVYTKTEAGSGFSSYTKVTSAPSDWSGKYLISDGTSTATGAQFSSTALAITTLTPGTTEYTAYEFTITKNGNNNNYYIISPDGTYYVGYSGSSANLVFSTSTPSTNAYLWTCNTSDPMTLNVGTNTRYIGVGTESQTGVFKAYSTAGTNAKCYLYKRIEGGATTSYISVPNCCTSYDITKAEGGTVGGGTFSADATSACEGATVTLSTNICSGYTVGAWDVYKTGTPATKITVTSNQFTMPAYCVTVALSTTAKVDHFKDAMHETSGYTGDGYPVSGCNQTVPNLSNTTPASECEGEHYKFIGWVDDAHVDSDGTLLTGYSIVSGGTTSWNATGTTYYAIWAKEL